MHQFRRTALLVILLSSSQLSATERQPQIRNFFGECIQSFGALVRKSDDVRYEPTDKIGKPESWNFDGYDGARYYDKDFVDLYKVSGGKSIQDILKTRKQNGQTNHVLDLFGSGFVVEDQSLANSITGVRFGPFNRTSHDSFLQKAIAKMPPTPTEVLGDAFHPNTWTKLRESMQSRNIPKFDLVTMRPVGAWQYLPFYRSQDGNCKAVTQMVDNVLPLLSSDGQFYFSVGPIVPSCP